MELPLIMYEMLMAMNAGDMAPDLASWRSSSIFRLHPSHPRVLLKALGRLDDITSDFCPSGNLACVEKSLIWVEIIDLAWPCAIPQDI